MRASGKPFTKGTPHLLSRLSKKLLLLLLAYVFTFSTEGENLRASRSEFSRGFESLQNRDFTGAIQSFTRAYVHDKKEYYGELSYLYLGKAYALLSYYSGKKEGVYSAIAFLNMYPYHYKMANYIDLQVEFIGDAYLLLDMYGKAKDIFFSLYRKSGNPIHLLKFLYAGAMMGATDLTLLKDLDPKNLGNYEYVYYLVLGYANYNMDNYLDALEYMTQARGVYRYLEDDPHFLYRYAISHYMLGDWRKTIFYMEILSRKDIYKMYEELSNYYLALIYLNTGNYGDALKNIKSLEKRGLISNVTARLLYSQLWAFKDFMEKNKDHFPHYGETLAKIAWLDVNSKLSTPALLGLYYLALSQKKVYDEELLKMKNLNVTEDIRFNGLRVNLNPLIQKLRDVYDGLDPYSEDNAKVLKQLYTLNERNFLSLFPAEKLARALVYTGDEDVLKVVNMVEGPVGVFLRGQAMLLEDNKEGLNLIRSSLKDLKGADYLEAIFILGIMERNKAYLEKALAQEEIPKHLQTYIIPATFELADIYYTQKNYAKARDLYRKLMESLDEKDPMYWISAFRLAFSADMLNDKETVDWVVKNVQKKDNIVSRVILELWG